MGHSSRPLNTRGRNDTNSTSHTTRERGSASSANRSEPDATTAFWLDVIADIVVETVIHRSGDSEELPYGKTDTTH